MHRPTDSEGFTYAEAEEIVRDYVCASCYGLLTVHCVDFTTCAVACHDCGPVDLCGRVTKRSVAAEAERAKRQFDDVVKNLPDLYPDLAFPQERKKTEQEILKELGF
jgi:hypothetical protein